MSSAVTFQLFAKAPTVGAVKTRLCPMLDARDAATLHARMVEHTARMIATACAAIPRSCAELWCSPDATNEVLRRIARRHRMALRQQPMGDLGARMRFALHSAMPGRALLLGSDCPLLDAPALIDADRALRSHDAVFVPVEDGGYALAGCRGEVPDCFTGIAWSTSEVMAQTRAHMAAARTRWTEFPVAWDVDTAADLERLRGDARFSYLAAGLVLHGAAEEKLKFEQTL